MSSERKYAPPSAIEKAFNWLFGLFAGLGLGPSYLYRLEVRGRKSGKLHSTAVCTVYLGGKQYLVAPRGRTQWAQNAEAAGEVILKRGRRRRFRVRALLDSEKPAVLQQYLVKLRGTVQRFFPILPDAPLSAFAEIASGYPVFELVPA
jgi:F420H(2)-dependent quinone reductase